MRDVRTILPKIVTVLLTGYAAHLIAGIATDRSYQWDFQTYYYAAQADARGLNPYSVDQLHRLAGGDRLLRYVYPPPTLLAFRPFTAIAYPTAHVVWLGLKVLFLAGLLAIWWRRFIDRNRGATMTLFVILAFGGAVYMDMASGNVSVIEQFLLWLAFVFLLRRQALGFCIAVVLASVFKLTPIVFLLLLPLTDVPHRWRYTIVTFVVCAAVAVGSYVMDPVGYESFFASISDIREGGQLGNPSLLSLWYDLAETAGGAINGTIPPAVIITLYVISAAAILWIAVHRLIALRNPPSHERELPMIFLFCLTFALVVPRFKTYAFILLIPPAYHVIRHTTRLPAGFLLFVLLALTTYTVLPLKPVLVLFWRFYLLLLAFLVWALMLRLTRPTNSLPSTDAPTATS